MGWARDHIGGCLPCRPVPALLLNCGQQLTAHWVGKN
jgi:hypothetical protein